MRLIKSYFFIFFITLSFLGSSQESFKNEAEKIKYSNKLFEEQKFIEAEPLMLSFLSNKNNAEYNFKYGVCVLFKYADKSKAIPYLKKAIKDVNVDPRAFFYLGRVFHYNYLFQDALDNYNKFSKLANAKLAKSLNIDMYVKMCENGQSLMKNLSDIIVIDKKSTALDKFNYSYNLEQIGGRILPTEEFQTKLDKKKNHRPIIYFPTVKDLLFYSSYGENGENGLDIYYRKWLSSGGWSEAKLLPENINSSYDEDFPFLNADGTTFYFCSKGHNSMGGYDIFRCNFESNSNDFGPISNLDYKINSTDDDILYIVDRSNENAIFSSKRSSEGGKIDVYDVKVKVLPMQNIIIAGTFKNSIIPDDIEANIKIQDVRTNKLIASYTVGNDSKYNILLPNSGKYKFIVETPKSEKIHAGLVEVPPQNKLKALKQEIELIKKNGQEKLIIKDYFDQSPEDEATIIANLLKKMSEPEINIDQFPDSVLNEIAINNESESVNEDSEIIVDEPTEFDDSLDLGNNDFNDKKENLIKIKKESIDNIIEQKTLISNIAKLKTKESLENAEKADEILLTIDNQENDSIKNVQLQLAAEYNLKSKILNEEANYSIALSKRLEEEKTKKEQEIISLSNLNSEKELIAESANNEQLISINKELNNVEHKEKSTLQNIRQQAKLKEENSEFHLTNAQNLRSDQESLIFQIDKEKEILNKTKKKKIIEQQNLKINELQTKVSELEIEIEDGFALYEASELEKKQLVLEADKLENIQVSKEYNNLELEDDIDLIVLEEDNTFVKTNLIEKNNPQLESVIVDVVKINKELNVLSNNSSEGLQENNDESLNISSNVNSESSQNNEILSTNNSQTSLNESINSNSENIINEDNSEVIVENKSVNEEILTKKEQEAIAFVENLPINIPVAEDIQEVPAQTINGVVYDSKSNPKTYKVVALVDDDVAFTQKKYENETNNRIIEINKKNIDKVNDISNQADELELQKLDITSEKGLSKIDKKILKLNKKKAKAQLKMSDDMAYVNENELKHLNSEIESSKKEILEINSESFKIKQAIEFEAAANILSLKADSLREQASNENDKFKKGKLIDEAIQNENTAINYLKKSKKLYAEAVVEDFSNDKLSVAMSLNPNQTKQSVRLENLSQIALEESKKLKEKAIELKEEGNLIQAKEYENLAQIQKKKSSDYKQKSLDFKELEMAIVDDIEISKSLLDAEVMTIASSSEFKSYHESEKIVNNLEIENQKLKAKKDGYTTIYNQMNAESEALLQQSKNESDPKLKSQLIKESKALNIEAEKVKSYSDALVYSMDSINREIKNKEMNQAMVLDMLDSTQKSQIKALSLSGMGDSVLALLPDEIPEEISSEIDSIISDSISSDMIIEELSEDIVEEIQTVSISEADVLSKDFVPPPVIKENIFIRTDQEIYSKDNPIPLNPKLPKGLIYKVQVGAFRNPIPQNLFKGFAPISAEKVKDDITRYRVGYFKTFQNANDAKNQVRSLGYKDAFVVALNNGSRIKLSEARTIQVNFTDEDKPSNNSNNELITLKNQIANDNSLASVKTIDQINGLFYSVQIGAFSKPLSKDNNLNISPLIVSRYNNLYKYSTGEYPNIQLAAAKKLELINNGLLKDAFIIAYNNGRKISLNQATSINPNRVVEYKNPTIYYINFGTYNNDSPEVLNPGNLELRDYNIKSRARFDGKQFFSKKYNSLSEAQTAINKVPENLSNSKIVKSSRDDFNFNYEYKVVLRVQDETSNQVIENFGENNNLNFVKKEIDGNNRYYSKSRDDYESATTDLNLCKTQGFNDAVILVFKDGIETTLEQTLKSFK